MSFQSLLLEAATRIIEDGFTADVVYLDPVKESSDVSDLAWHDLSGRGAVTEGNRQDQPTNYLYACTCGGIHPSRVEQTTTRSGD